MVHSTGADGKHTVHSFGPSAATASASVRPDSSGFQPNRVGLPLRLQVAQCIDAWMWPAATVKNRDQPPRRVNSAS